MIRGTVRVDCPACGAAAEHTLVQTIDTRENPADKQRLLAGELNLLACACGRRTRLEAQLLYKDPDAGYFAQVCPGGDAAVAEGAAAFAASGVTGTLRIVPSHNALVEKVKLLDAGLADWAIEMTKALLVAPTGDVNRVLLFDGLDGDQIRWLMIDGGEVRQLTSSRAGYDKLALRQPPRELQIDRAWAIAAVQRMIDGMS